MRNYNKRERIVISGIFPDIIEKMMNKIIIEEGNLHVKFNINKFNIVELEQFSIIGMDNTNLNHENPRLSRIGEEMDSFPILEVNITGKSPRDMSSYKQNLASASLDFKYINHVIKETASGKELIITMKTNYDLYAYYHMIFYTGLSMVRVYTLLENKGSIELPIEFVSSFIYKNLCSDGKLPYYEKTDIYTPYNSWNCEARWKKDDIEDLNISRMLVDGFNLAGYGYNRYYYTGKSSFSSTEYLPMGMAYDREVNESYIFQVESSGQWHIEYDTDFGNRLAILLSGPTEQEHGWWINLKPGMTFETVPAAFGVIEGGVSDAITLITQYRRKIRRKNADNENLNIVFNDFMNCLMGDPTYEKEIKIIDKAAELGCEYYCMDCGWYDKGHWWDRVGEWKESKERFPEGLNAICDYVRKKGMVMGLWIEIEVMGILCDFANKCPDDWFICRHGKRHIHDKRYLLDFRNSEVYQYCMDVMERLIQDYGIKYFKVDYNVHMGYGSDRNTDSCSGAISGHYQALHRWYQELFNKYPDLIIENCGSGGQRMDYGMLSLLSLQSTSDQTDYIYNSYIGTSIVTAVTPEQAGMWVYPYEDDEEHVIYNMVNGMLLRPYISGMVWKLGNTNMKLLAEGIKCYKEIRTELKNGNPFFPLGLNSIKDDALAYGISMENKAYLSVLLPKTDNVNIPLDMISKEIRNIQVVYPSKVNCEFTYKNKILSIKMPKKATARFFKIEF